MKIIVFSILFIVSCASNIFGQLDNQYRNKNWNPKAGKYYFSTQLTYTYHNDFEEDPDKRSGDMSIYLDEKTGTFLFTRESYGITGEMVDFVIADQAGNYTFGYTDEHGKKLRETIQANRFIAEESTVDSVFQQFFTKTGNTKSFGVNTYGWPIKNGEEYRLTFEKTNDTSYVYIAKNIFSFLPVYQFNSLESETKLPFNMDYSNTLPKKYNVLGQRYHHGSNEVSFELISNSPTEYFIDLKDYKVFKR